MVSFILKRHSTRNDQDLNLSHRKRPQALIFLRAEITIVKNPKAARRYATL